MSDPKNVIEEAIRKYGAEPLEMASTFTFECQPSCWGTCCRHIDIILTPYDVYRLAQALGKTMRQFVFDHCYLFQGHQSKWPVVILKGAKDGACEFLRPDGGCSVRDARPSVCHSSPVGRLLHMDDDGVSHNAFMLKLPHPMCQKKNSCPTTKVWTTEEWIKANQCEEWWHGTDRYYDLVGWAVKELQYDKWATEITWEIITPLLYGCDEATGGVDEEEMWRRSEAAVKYVLTHLASGYGYGPMKDEIHDQADLETRAARGAMGARLILETGSADPQVLEERLQQVRPVGFMIIHHGQLLKKFPSFELEDAQKVLEFLREAARNFEPVHDYVVVYDRQMSTIMGDELLRRSRMAELKRHRERRDAMGS